MDCFVKFGKVEVLYFRRRLLFYSLRDSKNLDLQGII